MNYRKVVLHRLFKTLIPILILTSCSPGNFYVDKDYSDREFDRPILLIPSIENIQIYEDMEVLQEKEKEFIAGIFSNLMNKRLAEIILPSSVFDKIYHVEFKIDQNLIERKLVLDDGNFILMDIPEKQIDVKPENAFILLIQDPYMAITRQEQESSDPAKHYQVTANVNNEVVVNTGKLLNKVILVELRYAIYDNQTAEVLYYGFDQYSENFNAGKKLEDIMQNGIRDIMHRVISNSPFAKR